jgi:UbiD family decarboxylase
LKTDLPNADFVIEGYVDPSSQRHDATGPLEKPKRNEGSFGDHTGYYTTPAKSSSASAPIFGLAES